MPGRPSGGLGDPPRRRRWDSALRKPPPDERRWEGKYRPLPARIKPARRVPPAVPAASGYPHRPGGRRGAAAGPAPTPPSDPARGSGRPSRDPIWYSASRASRSAKAHLPMTRRRRILLLAALLTAGAALNVLVAWSAASATVTRDPGWYDRLGVSPFPTSAGATPRIGNEPADCLRRKLRFGP